MKLAENRTRRSHTRSAHRPVLQGSNPVLLERAAQKADPGSGARIPLLAQLVEARLACGEDPQQTIADLAACAEVHPTALAHAHARA
jgi:hypothetical protein